jgi:hypothetical protein
MSDIQKRIAVNYEEINWERAINSKIGQLILLKRTEPHFSIMVNASMVLVQIATYSKQLQQHDKH